MLTTTPFTDGEMKRLDELFFDYIILGGMPAVVANFIESKNFSETLAMQRQILLEYRNDIRKYTEGLDQAKVVAVLDSVPTQLAKEFKRFQYSRVASGARAKDYWGCVEWLRDALVPLHELSRTPFERQL